MQSKPPGGSPLGGSYGSQSIKSGSPKPGGVAPESALVWDNLLLRVPAAIEHPSKAARAANFIDVFILKVSFIITS